MSWSGLVEQTVSVDTVLFHTIAHSCPSRPGKYWNKLISRLADGPAYALLAFLPLLSGHANGSLFLAAMALGFALELPLYKGIKHAFRRPRPCDVLHGKTNLLPIPDTYSFPSGHTAGAFVVAGLTLGLFPSLAPLAYLYALCVAYSRVYLRLHYPVDTLAGAALGSACAAIALPVAARLLEVSV